MAGLFVLDFVVCKQTVSGKRWQNISHDVAFNEMPSTESGLNNLIEEIKERYLNQTDIIHVFFVGEK